LKREGGGGCETFRGREATLPNLWCWQYGVLLSGGREHDHSCAAVGIEPRFFSSRCHCTNHWTVQKHQWLYVIHILINLYRHNFFIEVRMLAYPQRARRKARPVARVSPAFRAAPRGSLTRTYVLGGLGAAMPVDGVAFLPGIPRWLRR
jgi:hypothetical protein